MAERLSDHPDGWVDCQVNSMSEVFCYLTQGSVNIAVIVKSNLSEHQHVEVDGWNHFLFRQGSTPVPVDSRSQQKWGTGDIMVVGSKHLSRVINT